MVGFSMPYSYMHITWFDHSHSPVPSLSLSSSLPVCLFYSTDLLFIIIIIILISALWYDYIEAGFIVFYLYLDIAQLGRFCSPVLPILPYSRFPSSTLLSKEKGQGNHRWSFMKIECYFLFKLPEWQRKSYEKALDRFANNDFFKLWESTHATYIFTIFKFTVR